MTNGGMCLEKWTIKIPSKARKMTFVLSMLKQVIPGLKKLHSAGYSHGDMKPENICARESRDGEFKFTLIDLGMCSKLMKPDTDSKRKYFRGNYIFCHAQQIKNKRPTALDDLYSLVCVAYKFVFGTLPWLERIEKQQAKNPRMNVYDIRFFSKFRIKYAAEFDAELVLKSEKLKPLFKYLIETRRKYNEPDPNLKVEGVDRQYEIDYDKALSLLPNQAEYRSDSGKETGSMRFKFVSQLVKSSRIALGGSVEK